MKAIDTLKSEHRVIEQVLSAMETGAWLLSLNEPIRPDFFIDAADFITGFADGCHHKKEEGVLFKALVDNGMLQKGSPVAAMLHEHEMARSYTNSLRASAERLKAGDSTALPEVILYARRYAVLLRNHIEMEDQILFLMVDDFIPTEQQHAINQRFETIDHADACNGLREKYLALVGALEKEVDM